MANQARVGNNDLFVVLDGYPAPIETSHLFPELSANDWSKYKEWLTDDGLLPVSWGFSVIKSSGATVIVDTGMGPGPHELLGNEKGKLIDNLSTMGINPSDVDIVVMTHLHPDHVGWNIVEDGVNNIPAFPNAQYFVPKDDWNYFTSPDVIDNNPQIKNSVIPLKDNGVLELVGDGFRFTPEISAISTPGHTPGHISVLITSFGEKAIIVGDIYHSPAQISENDWCAIFDIDKKAAIKTRRDITDSLQDENIIAAAPHFDNLKAIGKVYGDKNKRVWRAL